MKRKMNKSELASTGGKYCFSHKGPIPRFTKACFLAISNSWLVQTLHPYFWGWNMEIFKFQVGNCTTCFWDEIWKFSFQAWKFALHVSRWNEENFIFQARNSVPRVSRLKCREFHVSGRKLSTPSFWAEMLKVSYFRQEIMCPNFPGWNLENFVIQSGNSVPPVPRLKYGGFHYLGR